jgi:hypothetical protein
MNTIQLAGGKNRQQKREKQKNKKSKDSKYTKKHIRVQQAMTERRKQIGKKNQQSNNNQTTSKKEKNKKKKGGGCKLGKYDPEECCLPGIPCHYPCYRKEYDNDIGRCVNEDGEHSSLKEIMKLTQCERGEYNPDECCESTEYGPTCYAPCYDEENCYDMNGDIPMKKIYKRKKANELLKKLKEQKAGAYHKIFNPVTSRWVSTTGKLGQNILKNYLNQV